MESLLKFKIQLFYKDDILQDKDKVRLLEDNLKNLRLELRRKASKPLFSTSLV